MRCCWFIILVCSLASCVAIACSDDDDDHDDSEVFTCDDLCQRAAECGTPCIPGDCASYCAESLSQADMTCVGLAQCDQFNDCVCSDDDDDAVDDDTGDDDTGDDDTGDDDTGDDDTSDDDTGDDDTGDDDDVSTICFIYRTWDSLALDFKSFLEGEGYEFMMIAYDDFKSEPDFSDVDLFIVSISAWFYQPWLPQETALVTDTGKPIICGDQGCGVLDNLGTTINHSSVEEAQYSSENIIAKVEGHDIWSSPYDLGLAFPDPTVQVYTYFMDAYVIEKSPAPLQWLGKHEFSGEYYRVVLENDHYAFWGFFDKDMVIGPTYYTEQGKQLFVNLIEYLLSNAK